MIDQGRLEIRLLLSEQIAARQADWQACWESLAPIALSQHPAWLLILETALQQEPHLIEARWNEQTVGLLPLSYVKSRLFGRFLVSLPYLNTAGVQLLGAAGKSQLHTVAEKHPLQAAGTELIRHAVQLADKLNVRYLELRHEERIVDPALGEELTSKVHMRLQLPRAADKLWHDFSPKVRNQIRKAESHSLAVQWGHSDLLPEFYEIFSRNMRDLGTPVYPRRLFAEILNTFPADAELCVIRSSSQPIAAALLLHGRGVTEVPSASSLRTFNFTNANMLLYWHLLQRAISRGQQTFDFGRSSAESNTYRFKKQWGAQPAPAVWQYYVRQGSIQSMRPDDERNQRLIRIWQRLPVWLTRQLGPLVVRGIP